MYGTGSTFQSNHIYNGQVVALKVQRADVEYPTNPIERRIYPALQGGVGIPTMYASGIHGEYDFLAMSLLGKSLDSIYRKNGKMVMDLRSVCSIAIQLVSVTTCLASGPLHLAHFASFRSVCVDDTF
jgi:casein kinase 1